MLCLGILWLYGWVYCGWGVRCIVTEVLGILWSLEGVFCVWFVLKWGVVRSVSGCSVGWFFPFCGFGIKFFELL